MAHGKRGAEQGRNLGGPRMAQPRAPLVLVISLQPHVASSPEVLSEGNPPLAAQSPDSHTTLLSRKLN